MNKKCVCVCLCLYCDISLVSIIDVHFIDSVKFSRTSGNCSHAIEMHLNKFPFRFTL